MEDDALTDAFDETIAMMPTDPEHLFSIPGKSGAILVPRVLRAKVETAENGAHVHYLSSLYGVKFDPTDRTLYCHAVVKRLSENAAKREAHPWTRWMHQDMKLTWEVEAMSRARQATSQTSQHRPLKVIISEGNAIAAYDALKDGRVGYKVALMSQATRQGLILTSGILDLAFGRQEQIYAHVIKRM